MTEQYWWRVHPDENGDCSSSKHPHTHQISHINHPDHLLCVLVVIHTILLNQ